MRTIKVPTYYDALVLAEFLSSEKGLDCVETDVEIVCGKDVEEFKSWKQVKKTFFIKW